MRIAEITPRYHPYIGGVETVVKQISEEMIKQGHQVDVLTVDPLNNLPASEDINSIRVRRFPQTGLFCYSLPLLNFLKKNCHHYDVIHTHSLHSFLPYMAASAVKQFKECKLVITGHYHGRGKTPLTTLLLRLYRPFIKNFLSEAQGISCVSHFEAKLISNHFDISSKKIIVIPNGVAFYNIKIATPYAQRGTCILIVSRQEEYKNIQLAIYAMPYLPEDFRLVIIGEGPYRHQLEKITTELNLGNRVAFLGRLKNEEVYRWYKTCNLVLNLSRLEAFGLTVIEGLVAEKPILINNSTALGELATLFKNVKAIEADRISPRQIADNITQLVKKPYVEQDLAEYQWDDISLKYCQFFKEICTNI